MRKHLSFRSIVLLGIAALILIFLPPACKRDKVTLTQQQTDVSDKIAKVKKWWEERKTQSADNMQEVQSRIPNGTMIQSYWQNQFQNAIPKWSSARVFTVGDETIYEVPFQFPDGLALLNDKSDSPPQMFLTGKERSGDTYKTSRSYLIVKEKPGTSNVAEIMCVVLHNPYVRVLDSLNAPYPEIRISNVCPSVNNIGEFSGSVKFYDLNGVQLLEEGYNNGTIFDYIEYGRCNFPIKPYPNLSTTRMYQVCTWTYVYQQNCAPDAGCTDWILIGVMFNGCETIITPDSPPVILPPSVGGGGSYPPPPTIEQNPPIPNADLCGKYTWKRVGDSHTTQIKNLGAEFVWTKSDGSTFSQSIILGWVCVEYPKWVSDRGYDINGFVNRAFNEAKWKVLFELNNNLLPGSTAAIQPRFKELITRYIRQTGTIYVGGATIAYHNGCAGDVPLSQPKWCAPAQ